MVVWGYGGGGRDNRVAILQMVTKAEHLLIDLNTAPRHLTDREGELVFQFLWSYVEEILFGGFIAKRPPFRPPVRGAKSATLHSNGHTRLGRNTLFDNTIILSQRPYKINPLCYIYRGIA